MPARRRDDVPAVASDVEALAESAGRVGHGDAGVGEIGVPPARPGADPARLEGLVARDQAAQRQPAGLTVDVEDHQAALPSGLDRDVGVRVGPPPVAGDRHVIGGVAEAVGDQATDGVLADAVAVGHPARAVARPGRPPQRQDEPAAAGVRHRRQPEGVRSGRFGLSVPETCRGVHSGLLRRRRGPSRRRHHAPVRSRIRAPGEVARDPVHVRFSASAAVVSTTRSPRS